MDVGDKVNKTGGDYTFQGTIVAKFAKLSGLERYVVENPDGVLHIFSQGNLIKLPAGWTMPPETK